MTGRVGSLRRCAVSHASLPKQQMVRFVVAANRELVPDFAERLAGRGIWLNAEGDMLEAARARGALARAVARHAKAAVTIPSDFRERLVTELGKRIAELLRIARRARQAVAGTAHVRAWHGDGLVGVLLLAEDASEAERALFAGAIAINFSRAALGAAFGCEPLAHVAVRRGRLAATIESAALRRVRLAKKSGITGGVHGGRQ